MSLRPLSVLFLFGYLSCLLIHASNVPWHRLGLELYAAAGAGIILSWLAHRGKNHTIGLLFLLSHLILEWLGHAKHSSHYSDRELALYGIHALFDTGFLWLLLREANSRLAPLIFAGGICCLLVLFFGLRQSAPATQGFGFAAPMLMAPHQHIMSTQIEFLVWGGIIGCVSAHIRTAITRSAS